MVASEEIVLESGLLPAAQHEIPLHRVLSASRSNRQKKREDGHRWRSYVESYSKLVLEKVHILRMLLMVYVVTWSIQVGVGTTYHSRSVAHATAIRQMLTIALSLFALCLSFSKTIILAVADAVMAIHALNMIWWAATRDEFDWTETTLIITQSIAISNAHCWDFKLVMFNNCLTLVASAVRLSLSSQRPGLEIAGDVIFIFAFLLGHGFIFSSALAARLKMLVGLREQKIEKIRRAEAEHKQMISLVLNMLPNELARKVLENQSDNFHVQLPKEDTSILILDLVGFTAMSSVHSPTSLLDYMNSLYSSMDQLCQKYKIEKVRTVGDSYICAGNVTIPNQYHKSAILKLGLELIDLPLLRDNPLKEILTLRIGISCGTAVYGVTGHHRWHYDVTGPVFYEAEVLEPICRPGTLLVSETFWSAIENKEEFKYTVLFKRVMDRFDVSRDITCVEIEGYRGRNNSIHLIRSDTTEDFLRQHQVDLRRRLHDHSKRYKMHRIHGYFEDGGAEYDYRSKTAPAIQRVAFTQTLTCILLTITCLIFDHPYYSRPTPYPVWPLYLVCLVPFIIVTMMLRKFVVNMWILNCYALLRSMWCIFLFAALWAISDYNESILMRGSIIIATFSTTMILSYAMFYIYLSIMMAVVLIASAFQPNLNSQILRPEVASIVLLFYIIGFHSTYSIRVNKALYGTIQTAELSEQIARDSSAQTDKLIRMLLPEHIYHQLSINHKYIAETYPEVKLKSKSILNSGQCGCMFISVPLGPNSYDRVAEMIFAIDRKIISLGLEKIKRVKTAFMIVTGLKGPTKLEKLVELAHFFDHLLSSIGLSTWYAGIAVGPCAGGVVGNTRVCFDMWGDTINTSSRMMSTAPSGTIQVTESVAQRLEDKFRTRYRGKIAIKGKGEMNTWCIEKMDSVEEIPGTPRS
ncbi:Adenylate cyclase, family 3 (some proteins containing HAMP domain) [Planoprotostelium fungivorum]|uniref:adenylate cyclase n=1 Tax=Planoprotostelium fungivorum TaxID=1890364 RepID=A0A2P6NHH2_9EUKA|nr:Adenylate cyclase, family 3 (some proteins containing HAMP domain) [Planoprotostelium fungivorum]